ncbi:MAG: hypothetical protein GY754_32395 [bacterium]|nr:hypothetical protein [bacterium]
MTDMKLDYTKTFTINLYEVGPRGSVKLSNILNFFQETASEQSGQFGAYIGDLLERNLTWVVSRYHLKILQPPAWKQTINITTWRVREFGKFAVREFEVTDESGVPLIQASSSWVMLNTAAKKPVDSNDYFPEYPRLNKRVINDPFDPLPAPEKTDFEESFRVRMNDLDINRHVNNSLYIAWALESIQPDIIRGLRPLDIEVAFKGEALYGDSVLSRVRSVNNQPGVFLHSLIREKDGKELTRLRTSWGK